MDIRENIINNFKDCNIEEINESITSSLSSKDELVLPGLGVFFELYWNSCSEDEKKSTLNKLYDVLKK